MRKLSGEISVGLREMELGTEAQMAARIYTQLSSRRQLPEISDDLKDNANVPAKNESNFESIKFGASPSYFPNWYNSFKNMSHKKTCPYLQFNCTHTHLSTYTRSHSICMHPLIVTLSPFNLQTFLNWFYSTLSPGLYWTLWSLFHVPVNLAAHDTML